MEETKICKCGAHYKMPEGEGPLKADDTLCPECLERYPEQAPKVKPEWTSTYEQYALDCNVLAVAKINHFNGALFDWAVYCTAVPGQNHDDEYIKVTKTGSKVRTDIAVLMFPRLPVGKYRR